jgi:hypothetical protein
LRQHADIAVTWRGNVELLVGVLLGICHVELATDVPDIEWRETRRHLGINKKPVDIVTGLNWASNTSMPPDLKFAAYNCTAGETTRARPL